MNAAQLQASINISFDVSKFDFLCFSSLAATTIQATVTAQSTDWPRQQWPPCQVPQPHVHLLFLVNTMSLYIESTCYLKVIFDAILSFSTMTIVN